MPTVYIALGSNVGDREANLRRAVQLMEQSGVAVTKLSSLYETEPVFGELIGIWLVETWRGADAPARFILAEAGPGIDLDILLYGDAVIDAPALQVPHPRMLQRNFVLAPLAEIAPQLRHPSWSTTIANIYANSPDRSQVRCYPHR